LRFFERQAQARRLSRRLLWLFALAVVAVVIAVNAACVVAFALLDPWLWSGTPAASGGVLARLPRHFFETNTAVTLLFIVGGALVEEIRLREGGAAVARMLGAREVGAQPADAAERRLVNVAQEIAIAAGARIPALYVLDGEHAINACAAGHDARDAALILTRGALERLDRDELQGVVAHEMAHVLHGDVRLNLRLAACAYGVLIVFLFGRSLLGYRRNGAARGEIEGRGGAFAPLAFVLGAAILSVGAIGWLAARLLQAGVGRQREFLADATAIRLTRLPEGLGNALRKVLAQEREGLGRLSNPAVATTAHAWMAAPDSLRGLLATHPPVSERIRRIFGRSMAPLAHAASAAWPTQWHVAAGAAAHPDAASRIALALLAPGRTGVLPLEHAPGGMRFEPDLLDPSARQALLETACATLRHEPHVAKAGLLRQARRLIESDGRVTLAEFAAYLTMADRLGLREPATRARFPATRARAGQALSLLVRAALQWPGSALAAPADELAAALERAAGCWGAPLPAPAAAPNARSMMAAVGAIDALGPLDQALAVKALAAALAEDGGGAAGGATDDLAGVDPGQGALLRALCVVWGVPVPPRFGPCTRPLAASPELPALEFATAA